MVDMPEAAEGCSLKRVSRSGPRLTSGSTITAMSLSLVSNAYLEETSAKIRAKPVPWEVHEITYSNQ